MIELTLPNIVGIATLISIIFGIIVALVRFGENYLTAKLNPSHSGCPVSCSQSDQCRSDHAAINGLISIQNGNIKTMLEQNQLMITALTSMSHANEMRHLIVVSQIEKLSAKIE